MRYSCLLVDDEEDVITAIKKKLDWDSLGYMPPRQGPPGRCEPASSSAWSA